MRGVIGLLASLVGGLVLGLVVPATYAQTPTHPAAGRGSLTIIVRDSAGTRLAGISATLFQDTDLDGRVFVAITTTDSAGTIRYPDLAWGLYIVQFGGRDAAGRAMLPPDQQNLGVLDDGSGIANGFGVRFADAERSELFVIGTLPDTDAAVPMFDMAASVADPPQPYDPIVALLGRGPTPTPFLLRDVVEGRVDVTGQPIRRERWDGWWLTGMALGLWASAVLGLWGWWRIRREPDRKEDANARLD